MKPHLLLGTAGHIDHGKTALVKALTGVDTDRLPDEKARGITIDLGFAPLELDEFMLGVIDVPGHERLVKNMLAGASGVDLALLVVAVDDSVKPQTREHLEILENMRLPGGVVALTKVDLADDDWIDLVAAEVSELTAGTFLERAEIVRISAKTGEGLQELRGALSNAARTASRYRANRSGLPLRMAIDRSFTVAGHGAVVTGSILTGEVRLNDELELQPQGERVRVRSLQSHGSAAERLQGGQRAAVNLVGLRYDQITRGHCLCSPGAVECSRLLTAAINSSAGSTSALEHHAQVRVNIGAAEVLGRLNLMGRAEVLPGEEAFAQIALRESVAVAWGQPFVLRSMSPVQTLGGGRVLEGVAEKRKRLDPEAEAALIDLGCEDPALRAAAACRLRGTRGLRAHDLFAVAGVEEPHEVVRRMVDDGVLVAIGDGPEGERLLHARTLADLRDRCLSELSRAHERTPLKFWVERSKLATRFQERGPTLLTGLLDHLEDEGLITADARGVALPEWRPRLSEQQQQTLQRLEERLDAAGLRPPGVSELSAEVEQDASKIVPLLDLAVEQRRLVRIADDLYLATGAVETAKTRLLELRTNDTGFTVSQIRDSLDTSRKIAVPLCEHLDAVGFTVRRGDVRTIVA